jgi:hypothetical protein
MSARLKLTGILMASVVLCLPVAGADTQTAHRTHKAKKQELPPPLPSGPRGPVPQIPLDSIPAVAPEVTYQDGLLTIVAPNSTLADILRGVRKHTSADIEIPPTASERVVTRLGPGPAREVVAELLNGSRFNYILLGSPEDAKLLVRVVLVAKSGPDTPDSQPAQAGGAPPQQVASAAADADADAADDTADDTAENVSEPEQPAPAPPDQPAGVKTPQQMLQEMQQRQLQQSGQPGAYPPAPGVPIPQHAPQQPPPDQPQQ